MGLTLQGAGSFAGNATTSFRDQREDNREQAEENRTKEQYDLEMKSRTQQAMKAVFEARAAVDEAIDPITQAPEGAIPTPGGPQPQSPQAGGSQGQAQAPPTPGAAAPAPAQAPPTPGAAAPAQVPTQQQPAKRLTRREKYQDWYSKARSAVIMAGGIEAVALFDQQENAYSRSQMKGYGMAGVAAMKVGNAGEAVRQLNTMLEVSPQDLGMQFEAYDGKVYLVGANGKRNKPFDQGAVMELLNGKLLTTEAYLAMQEEARKQTLAERTQTEVERAAPIKEKTEQQRADASTTIAATDKGQLALDTKYRGEETKAKTATALAALINAKSSRDRAAALLAGASDWTPGQQLQIYKDADTWSNTDEMIPKDIQKAYQEDPLAWGKHKSDVMNQMTHNPYKTGPTREEASAVSMLLRQPGGADLSAYMNEEDDTFNDLAVKQENGVVLVNYDGKTWKLPYNLAIIAIQSGKLRQATEPPKDATTEVDDEVDDQTVGALSDPNSNVVGSDQYGNVIKDPRAAARRKAGGALREEFG